MKKQKKKKKLKKKRIKNTRKKRGNNNHNKNNNGNRISQFINKEPKSLNPIITNDIEEDFKMMSDDISGELGDFYWNIFRFKDVLETFLIGEVGIVRLGFYQSRKDVKPHIILGSIEIREKDRGKGIGKKWINSIINITKSYDYGLVLKPSCLDYGDNCYKQNKMFLERVIPRIENPVDKMRLHNHLIESISRYENTPPKQRNHLLIENSARLVDYYSNLGFIPFNETHMVYDKELKMLNNWDRPTYDKYEMKIKERLLCKDYDYSQRIEDKRIYRTDIKCEDYFDGVKPKPYTHYENLPNDLREKITDVFSQRFLRKGMCANNSTLLSLFIDDVKKVDGWYGRKKQELEEFDFIRKIGDGFWLVQFSYNKSLPNSVQQVEDSFHEIIYDEKNNKVHQRHCWNSYKDLHFDITRDAMERIGEDWSIYDFVENTTYTDFDINSLDGRLSCSLIDFGNYYHNWFDLNEMDTDFEKHFPIVNMNWIENEGIIKKVEELKKRN